MDYTTESLKSVHRSIVDLYEMGSISLDVKEQMERACSFIEDLNKPKPPVSPALNDA